MRRIRVEASSAAPPERVWELLADVTTWTDWSPFEQAELEQRGDGLPEGIGAVRRLASPSYVGRERVVACEAPAHFACELVSNEVLRGYRADITLARARNGGTTITWEARLRARRPGAGRRLAADFQQLLADTAERLARAAEGWEASRRVA